MGITAYLPVYWLIALVVFLVIEAATLGLATIWFAGGALVALIAVRSRDCDSDHTISCCIAGTSVFYTSVRRSLSE